MTDVPSGVSAPPSPPSTTPAGWHPSEGPPMRLLAALACSSALLVATLAPSVTPRASAEEQPTAAQQVLAEARAISTSDRATSAWVDKTLKVLKKVWKREVGDLGYRAPLSDGGLPSSRNGGNGKFDVYLADVGADLLYGYCSADFVLRKDRTRAGGYCVLDNDFSKDQYGGKPGKTLAVTAAHEFFHAIQFGYDYYEDRWFMESTATWMEERFADGVNDNRQYLAFGQVGEPATSLDLFERGGFAHYGNWPFWEHLSERYGHGIVRRTWNTARGSAGGDLDVRPPHGPPQRRGRRRPHGLGVLRPGAGRHVDLRGSRRSAVPPAAHRRRAPREDRPDGVAGRPHGRRQVAQRAGRPRPQRLDHRHHPVHRREGRGGLADPGQRLHQVPLRQGHPGLVVLRHPARPGPALRRDRRGLPALTPRPPTAQVPGHSPDRMDWAGGIPGTVSSPPHTTPEESPMTPTGQSVPTTLARRRTPAIVDGASVAAAGLVQAALILAAPAVGHGLVAVRSLRGSGLD